MIDLASLPYEKLLSEFKPIAVFLVVYCVLFAFLGKIGIFSVERRPRLVVSFIVAVYATNSIIVNGWDKVIVSAIGSLLSGLLSRVSKFQKTQTSSQ